MVTLHALQDCKFQKNMIGLYAIDTNYVNTFVITKQEFQFIQAKKARELYEAMRNLSVNDIKFKILMNIFKKNKVTTDYVNFA